jgi:hypothetical protein
LVERRRGSEQAEIIEVIEGLAREYLVGVGR